MIRIAVFLFLVTVGVNAYAAPPAEAFGTLPKVYDAAISPDGKQIAVIVNFDGTYGVRVLTIGKKGEELRAVLLGDGVKPNWVRWVNNKRVLVGMWQSQDYDGVPISTSFIYTLDAAKMKGEILVKTRLILRQNNSYVIDFLDHDPDHILMGFSDDNQFLRDVQRVNVKSGKYRKIERAPSLGCPVLVHRPAR